MCSGLSEIPVLLLQEIVFTISASLVNFKTKVSVGVDVFAGHTALYLVNWSGRRATAKCCPVSLV